MDAEVQERGGTSGDELAGVPTLEEIERHPMDDLLRGDRLPHIWCQGCGIGTAVSCFISALMRSGLDMDKVAIVSGIGCTGRVAGYIRLDSFHTTHGRAIPFATGLKLANPELTVVVFSGDGDLIAIGGNHFIHAARRNMDINVICVNNFNYGMTGGQMGPTTPTEARTSTSRRGNLEHPFNVPYLAAAAGATYVARWTVLHARRLERSIHTALLKPGFTVVEAISPCPTLYGRWNRRRYGTDMFEYYHRNAVIRHDAQPWEVDIGLAGEIICGEFVDIERPTFQGMYERLHPDVRPSEDLELLGRPPTVLETGFEPEPVSAASLAKVARAEVRPVVTAGAAESEQNEIQLCGFGGQGIVLAGLIAGKAAALFDHQEATFTQSYGPESRGGACSAAIVTSGAPILYPYVTRPNVMAAMYQEAYTTYHGQLAEGGLLLIDEDLVQPDPDAGQRVVPIPATRIARQDLGRVQVANVVMLGAMAALSDAISTESLRQSVLSSVPRGTEELNGDAFDRGYSYAKGLATQ
jgi:2-oxoglutarate ferredoxin oxidoreductase subunit beta